MSLFVTPGVIVERVGDDLMVIVPGQTDVVSLSGHPVELLLDVKAGRKVDSTDPALGDLLDLGIVSAPGLSRRGLIKAGAIGAGAGIAVLAMPSVAAAASGGSSGGLTGTYTSAGIPDTYRYVLTSPSPTTAELNANPPELSVTGNTVFWSPSFERWQVLNVESPGTPLTGNVQGSFTLNGVLYTVTFSPAP